MPGRAARRSLSVSCSMSRCGATTMGPNFRPDMNGRHAGPRRRGVPAIRHRVGPGARRPAVQGNGRAAQPGAQRPVPRAAARRLERAAHPGADRAGGRPRAQQLDRPSAARQGTGCPTRLYPPHARHDREEHRPAQPWLVEPQRLSERRYLRRDRRRRHPLFAGRHGLDILSRLATKPRPLVLLPYPPTVVDMGQYLSRFKEASDLERLGSTMSASWRARRRPIPTARRRSRHRHPPIRGRHAGRSSGDASGPRNRSKR